MGVVGTGDMVITILEDCGTSLDKLLPLKYKKLAVNLADLAQAIYCFDGLFIGYDVSKIDPYLLEDIKICSIVYTK